MRRGTTRQEEYPAAQLPHAKSYLPMAFGGRASPDDVRRRRSTTTVLVSTVNSPMQTAREIQSRTSVVLTALGILLLGVLAIAF